MIYVSKTYNINLADQKGYYWRHYDNFKYTKYIFCMEIGQSRIYSTATL